MTATVSAIRRPRKAAWRADLATRLGPLSSYLGGFELHLRAKGQAAKTVEKKMLAARQLTAFLGDPDAAAVTRPDVEAFIAARLEATKRSSVATTFLALRAFFAYLAVDLGSYDSPMEGMVAPKAETPVVEPVADDVLTALLADAERGRASSWEDLRDAALLRCFIDTGGRLSEISDLTLSDIIPLDDGRMLLAVSGKGRGAGKRERHVPLGKKAGVALRRYLRARAGHPSADSPRLWLGKRGPMTMSGVRQMLGKRAARVGVHIHPHQLRHTWAVAMKADERNRDADIMHLAGWSSPQMLARYGRVVTAQRSLDAFYAHGAPGDKL